MAGERAINVIGVFSGADQLQAAVTAASAYEFQEVSIFSPIPVPEVEALLLPRKSPVRMFTLLGAVLGCFTGFYFASWAALQWNLTVGGKPVVALPAFAIIGFELTMLFGALATLLGVILFSRLSIFRSGTAFDARFSGDRFGLAITCIPSLSGRAELIFKNAGAEEVRIAKG
jgi:hypothetical protein